MKTSILFLVMILVSACGRPYDGYTKVERCGVQIAVTPQEPHRLAEGVKDIQELGNFTLTYFDEHNQTFVSNVDGCTFTTVDEVVQ